MLTRCSVAQGKMLTELPNDPKCNRNLKKLIMCLLGSSDVVSVESACHRNKLCREAVPLVSLRGQEELFLSPCENAVRLGTNRILTYLP